ncbi:ABC transporter ATP-binding protein [Kineococcus sp. SYSU DK005]|uniref:ABC transporter ATP-binding protein n=1 Tax=Kineococcus sp. SYSU DK005 TaxID=3383126 RepID=UPI003D7EADD4
MLRNVSRTYHSSSQPAVDDVTCEIARGDFFGLLGRNGAGKSTLIKMMVGLLQPDRGEIHVLGHKISDDRSGHLSRVGYMPQSAFALNNLTVAEALLAVSYLRGLPLRRARTHRDELIEVLGLSEIRHRVARSLSGGQRRLLQLAATIAGEPEVLILDEPTNELDPGLRRFVWSYLKDLNRRGLTIILITHNALEAEQVIERVGIMRAGKLVAVGSPQDLKRSVAGEMHVRFLRTSQVTLPSYLEDRDPQGSYVDGYLPLDHLDKFLADVPPRDLLDLSITSTTLEDVYYGFA